MEKINVYVHLYLYLYVLINIHTVYKNTEFHITIRNEANQWFQGGSVS